ncbi:MAG TPA: hypothetical protein VHX38_02575 [Pseudonocardiaceae bacterium]|jgi:hypothetical protein|nr:hypothetical protein [Pseudonocardiaceae bacterium]
MATTTPAQQPVPQPPRTPPGWEHLAERAAEILAIEETARRALAPFRLQLQRFTRRMMATWVRTTGGLHEQANPIEMAIITADVLRGLEDLDPTGVASRVEAATVKAAETGWRQTLDELAAIDAYPGVDLSAEVDDIRRHVDLGQQLDALVRRELSRIEPSMRDRLSQAAHEAYGLGEIGRWSEVADIVTRAMSAATGAERIAHWVVNYAANQGSRDTARRLGFGRVWVAERNACVVCLALSGTVSVDAAFDGDATYGTRPLAVWPAGTALWQPPRHPWCRCRAEVWRGSVPGYNGPDLPTALRREAERSILTGWRLPSESESVRLVAARNLLARGTDLPKSVQQRARIAIARGAFGPQPRPRPRRSVTAK